MFLPYKAIIRHHINKDFYPTAHFLKSSFHVASYYLSIFYLAARQFSVYVGALLYVSCALRFLSLALTAILSQTFPVHRAAAPPPRAREKEKKIMECWGGV
jgi:hypothetical protein